jgi:hypothetical protein
MTENTKKVIKTERNSYDQFKKLIKVPKLSFKEDYILYPDEGNEIR